jgi:threonine dehydrogenase-like Zn-dependent dehydrogenase
MKAWEVREGALGWYAVDEPVPRDNETIVQVMLAGVCGSDVAKLTKKVIPTPPGLPWRPGHEIVGWNDGHLVAVNPLVSCGVCDRCRTGRVNACPSLQTVGWHLPGGFASLVAAPRVNVVRVPPGIAERVAVLAEPMAVAVHGVRCGLGNSEGRLGVIGSGALATATAAYAASRGWSVDLLVRNPTKLAGLAHGLAATVLPLQSAGRGAYDAVIDAAGGADDSSFVAAMDAVRDGGVIVVHTAYYPGVRLSRDLREPIRRGLTIVGSFSFCRRDGDDFAEALAFLASEQPWAQLFVRRRYSLEDLPQALADLHADPTRRPAKAILEAS